MSRPTRPVRGGAALAGLLLAAGVAPLTSAPALAEEVSPSTARVFGECLGTPFKAYADGERTASYGLPRAETPIAGAADAYAQTAKAYGLADAAAGAEHGRTGMNCSLNAQFDNVLHVGAGTTGKQVGDPVTLVATVEFDATLDEVTNGSEKHLVSWDTTGGYSIIDPAVSPWEPVASYVVSAQRQIDVSAASWYDEDGSWAWAHGWSFARHDNTSPADTDGADQPLEAACDALPCQPPATPAHTFDHGPQQLVFTTTVGAALEVSGAVSVYVTAYDGDVSAYGDGLDGLSAAVAPAAGFEGLQLTLGNDAPPPPVDDVAPAVTATPSSAANAAGWHKDPVTVELEATDAGSGVATLRYAVGDGEPVTVEGASASVPVDQHGATVLTYTAQDVAGNTSAPQSLTVKLDRTAPTLHLPSGVTVAATGPAGAVVDHAHTVTDDLSGATSSCTPAAGSTFAVGTTTVTCTATDGAGNTATGSFPVTVTAAAPTLAERLDALEAALASVSGPASATAPLRNELRAAERALAQGKHMQVCQHLGQLALLADKRSGKQLSAADAARLADDARAIRTVIGC